jgi:hypothetical protein
MTKSIGFWEWTDEGVIGASIATHIYDLGDVFPDRVAHYDIEDMTTDDPAEEKNAEKNIG